MGEQPVGIMQEFMNPVSGQLAFLNTIPMHANEATRIGDSCSFLASVEGRVVDFFYLGLFDFHDEWDRGAIPSRSRSLRRPVHGGGSVLGPG